LSHKPVPYALFLSESMRNTPQWKTVEHFSRRGFVMMGALLKPQLQAENVLPLLFGREEFERQTLQTLDAQPTDAPLLNLPFVATLLDVGNVPLDPRRQAEAILERQKGEMLVGAVNTFLLFFLGGPGRLQTQAGAFAFAPVMLPEDGVPPRKRGGFSPATHARLMKIAPQLPSGTFGL